MKSVTFAKVPGPYAYLNSTFDIVYRLKQGRACSKVGSSNTTFLRAKYYLRVIGLWQAF